MSDPIGVPGATGEPPAKMADGSMRAQPAGDAGTGSGAKGNGVPPAEAPREQSMPTPVPVEKLGKYGLLRHLATGGMAEIHLARVEGMAGFEKYVVVKRVRKDLAENRDVVEMFLDEARLALQLQHPNVVQVYDVGSVRGSFFFAMEFLHGEDVRSIVKQLAKKEKKLPLEHALQIIIGMCAGLHYAHEKIGPDGKSLNIVHRDATPQNVFVTYDGNVKVVDFGIAKAENRVQETRFGTIKGKIPYMSPEQCRSQPLDRRSDLFSIAIMLYELTTGELLYKGDSDFEIMQTIVDSDAPAPSSHVPDYPPELEKIVLRGLRRPPAERYQTAQELQLELEAFARENRLVISTVALARFMEETFGKKVEAWREAQKGGAALANLATSHSYASSYASWFEDSDPLAARAEAGSDLPTVASGSHVVLPPSPTATPEIASAVSHPSIAAPAPPSHRKVAILAGIGLAAAALAVVIAFARGGASHEGSPATAPIVKVETAQPAPAAPASPIAITSPAPLPAPAPQTLAPAAARSTPGPTPVAPRAEAGGATRPKTTASSAPAVHHSPPKSSQPAKPAGSDFDSPF